MTDESQIAPEPDGIVSVNSRGGTSGNLAGKVVFVVVVAAVLAIGTLYAINKWRAASRADEVKGKTDIKNENRPASIGVRRQFDSDPPPLPGHAPKPSSESIGPGSQRERGLVSGPASDARAERTPVGQPVVLQVQPTQSTAGSSSNGVPPPSRYAGDVIVPAPTYKPPETSRSGPPERAMQTLSMVQDMLNRTGTAAGGGSLSGMGGSGGTGTSGGAPQAGALGAMLNPTSTLAVQATMLGDRNLILPKGRTIDCGLSTRIVSEVAGLASCVLSADVYSDNGRVLLLERGSEAIGEYASTVQRGQQRLFVLWSRIKTPGGIVIHVASPAADSLGTSGLPGYVDNHWFERIGAAVMLSLVQDAIAYKSADSSAGAGASLAPGNAVLQNTQQTGSSLAEKILDSTINIKPTLYKNQGDRATIFVARDLDFGTVYALRPR